MAFGDEMTATPQSPYLQSLAARQQLVVAAIEDVMRTCVTVPVGDGFIDIITPSEMVERFIDGISRAGVAIDQITLWCNCTETNRFRYGCPHGYGGPSHVGGYYSEICESDCYQLMEHNIDIRTSQMAPDELVGMANGFARRYVLHDMKYRSDFSPCLLPGFWLAVPGGWKRESYYIGDREPA